MSTADSSLLEATQRELQMMKNCYSELYQAFEKFKAQCKCSGNKKQNDYQPPVKRQRLVTTERDIPSDPFLLDEPCVMKILSFLKPKELLESMEICQSWKQYIESSDPVMNRIHDGVILSIDFGEQVVPDDLRLGYKHMNIKFPEISSPSMSQMQESNANLLLKRCAPLLDTLRMSYEGFDAMPHPMNLTSTFPMLRKLRIINFWPLFQMLQKSSFPALEVLDITAEQEEEIAPMNISDFRVFLNTFPKLKHLSVGFGCDTDFFLDDSGDVSLLPLINDKTHPQLETIAFPLINNYYPAPFSLRFQQNSLTKLNLCVMDRESLSCCLRDLKKLKWLCISHLVPENYVEELNFPESASIEVLKIDVCCVDAEELSEVIFALPSLKELAVGDMAEQIDIRFIASNMRHFMRLLVSDDQKYSSVYRKIQRNANRYINTSFVIHNVPVNHSYYGSFEEFDFQ